MITAPNLRFAWLIHGFGLRDSIPPPGITTAQQIHSARVLDACGRRGEQIGEGDAIISAEAGVVIGIRTADCVPILLADPETRIVACVHAGWRGTAENIMGATIRILVSRGCQASNLRVAIGPSIGSCCYEVGVEVARQFETWLPNAELAQAGLAQAELAPSGLAQAGLAQAESPGAGTAGRMPLDLPAINQVQALDAGVRQIWKSGECTYCRADRFFSFRREKEQAGRMFSFISRVV